MILGPLYKVDSKGKIRVLSVEVDKENYRVIAGLEDGAKVTNKWTTAKPKNVGRANATTAEDQALKEANAKLEKKQREDYFLTKYDARNSTVFKPQLATEMSEKDIQNFLDDFGYLILDPKLDGMRLILKPDSRKSRRNKDVPTAQWIHEDLKNFFSTFPNITLDGELYNHKYHDNFESLMSLCRQTKLTQEDEMNAKNNLQYYVYDIYDLDNPDMIAEERKKWLLKALLTGPRVVRVPYKIVKTVEEFKAVHELYISLGYEGTIVRVPTEPYKNGRSKFMLKYKDFKTAEFTIIDIQAGKGNRSDIAGRIIVDVNGVEVGCGIRGSWEYAAELLKNRIYYLNRDATIRYFDETEDGSLRFPVCIDICRWDYE